MTSHRPVIVGVGASELGRDLAASATELAVIACRAALDDAGLAASDVDGVTSFVAAYEGAPLLDVIPALGLDPERLRLQNDVMALSPAAVTAIVDAVDAVREGRAETVIAFKTNKWKRGKPPGPPTDAPRIGGPQQFEVPYGNTMTAQMFAMWATRHFHLFGTREEHLGAIVLANRRHATRNPRATQREALTLVEYLASPWISTPLRKLDCDFPIDGAGALVVTTAERARDLLRRPIEILGGCYREAGWEEWLTWPDLGTPASKDVADRVWSATGAKPADVDVAGLYDGFSIIQLNWLEDAGFCAKGEGGPFAASGALDLGGRLPTNTHGGNLSEGRTHAMGHVIEVVTQLRGDADGRQVPGAKLGFVGAGGGPLAGAMLLSAG